jgi:hypothetical protein
MRPERRLGDVIQRLPESQCSLNERPGGSIR